MFLRKIKTFNNFENTISCLVRLKELVRQKCFGEFTFSRTQIFEYHKACSKGREDNEIFLHANYSYNSVNDN